LAAEVAEPVKTAEPSAPAEPAPIPESTPEATPEPTPDAAEQVPAEAVPAPPPAAGQAVWEFWRDQSGIDLRELKDSDFWETEATRVALVPRFASGRDIHENFVVRLRGEIQVPESGSYRFLLESLGEAVLWIQQPDGTETELAASRDGLVESDPIALEAGQSYELTLLHHGAEGPDDVRVGWIDPSGKTLSVLGSGQLRPVANAEEIEDGVRLRALVRPALRSYQPKVHMSRDVHRPRPDEHLTRETVYAAGAMLETNDPAQWEEAAKALRKVLPYQDISPRSSSFGNWPRVVERPGDFQAQNIGGFIGAELIHILQRQRDKLDEELVADIEKALGFAAMRSVRYDPPVTATNIVTKAVAVALLADQMLGVPEAGEWGRAKLRELRDHTVSTGMPTEYNSPTYNRVAMEGLSLLRTYLQDEELLALVEDLNRATWRELTMNYHPNLQLWTGPATRRYGDLDSPAARLQAATRNAFFFGENSTSRASQEIPGEFLQYLVPLTEPDERHIKVVSASPTADIIFQLSPVPLTATLYQHPRFSLGSFNRADLWDQRRPLIAFWGRSDAPGVLRLLSPSTPKGLLPAQVSTAQDKGRQLIVLNFVTDAGWGLDPYGLYGVDRSKPVTTEDVRLRFHSEGASRMNFTEAPASLTAPVVVQSGDVNIGVRLLHAGFGGYQPRWEVTRDGHLDLVLYEGEPIEINSLREAVCALVLEMSDGPLDLSWLEAASAKVIGGQLVATASPLKITAPLKPDSYPALQSKLQISTQP